MTRPDVTAGPIERNRKPEKTAAIGSGVGAETAAGVADGDGAGVGVWEKVVETKRQTKSRDRRKLCTIGNSLNCYVGKPYWVALWLDSRGFSSGNSDKISAVFYIKNLIL